MTEDRVDDSTQRSEDARPRRKLAAVLLAVFTGGWSWIYTWRWDSKKFLLGVVVPIVVVIVLLLSKATYVRMAGHYVDSILPPPETAQFIMGVSGLLQAYGPFVFVVLLSGMWWLWPVILQTARSSDTFRRYPNRI